jgi:hypothetical protein
VLILQDTGALRRSWDVRITGRREVKVFSDDFKAPFHEKGTRTIPKRRMTPTTRQIDPKLRRLATVYVRQQLEGGRRG